MQLYPNPMYHFPAWQTLHFRMNRTTEFGEIRGEAAGNAMTSPQMYQFEDEAFATVPELVLHHVTKQVRAGRRK